MSALLLLGLCSPPCVQGADPTSMFVRQMIPEKLHWTPFILDRKKNN